MNTNQKIKIYCVFTGLGKTYFCQHNLGWAEIEEESYTRLRIMPNAPVLAMQCYHKYGYKLLTNASPYILKGILKEQYKFDVVLILPDKTMKQEILDRVKARGDFEWAVMLNDLYDYMYDYAKNFKDARIIYAQPGEYLTDIMKREN